MKLMNRFEVMVVSIALKIVVMVPSSYAASNMVTDAELAMLPEYCQARIGKNKMASNVWSQRMGPEIFVHVHHYCFGLNYMSRANLELDPKKKKFNLQRAIANFAYVLKRWPQEFPLTSSAAMYRQQAEMMLSMTP